MQYSLGYKLLLEARGHRILRHMSPGEWMMHIC